MALKDEDAMLWRADDGLDQNRVMRGRDAFAVARELVRIADDFGKGALRGVNRFAEEWVVSGSREDMRGRSARDRNRGELGGDRW